MKRTTTHPNKAQRRSEAKVRQEAYDKLPLAEKISRAGKKELQKFVKRGGEGAALAQKRLDGK